MVELLWSRFCEEYDVPVGDLLAFAHGRPTRQTVTHFLPSSSNDEREAVARELDRRGLVTLDGIVAIAGARQLLASIAVLWAVVTSASRT